MALVTIQAEIAGRFVKGNCCAAGEGNFRHLAQGEFLQFLVTGRAFQRAGRGQANRRAMLKH